MMRQSLWCWSAGAILTVLSFGSTPGQDLNRLKSAVVRIHNSSSDETGTGFIVKLDNDLLYIVTAAHVVKRQQHPEIFLFNRPDRPALSATVVDRSGGGERDLALLTLRADPNTFTGLTAIDFADSTQLGGGDDVKIIGFPDGTELWNISSGTISRIEGNNLVFAGPVRGGNSGGPVILGNGQVIGLVTDTLDSIGASYAAKAESIVSYINGLVRFVLEVKPAKFNSAIQLTIKFDKIKVLEDGSAGSTRWDFEAQVNGRESVLVEQNRYSNGKIVSVNKSVIIRVVPNSTIQIKVVGHKIDSKDVTATGEFSIVWDTNDLATLSKEVSVKFAAQPSKGNFTCFFTIERNR